MMLLVLKMMKYILKKVIIKLTELFKMMMNRFLIQIVIKAIFLINNNKINMKIMISVMNK